MPVGLGALASLQCGLSCSSLRAPREHVPRQPADWQDSAAPCMWPVSGKWPQHPSFSTQGLQWDAGCRLPVRPRGCGGLALRVFRSRGCGAAPAGHILFPVFCSKPSCQGVAFAAALRPRSRGLLDENPEATGPTPLEDGWHVHRRGLKLPCVCACVYGGGGGVTQAEGATAYPVLIHSFIPATDTC